MEWVPVTAATPKSETLFKCARCTKEVHVHANYLRAAIDVCAGYGRCRQTEDVARDMATLRGWTYLNLTSKDGKSTIYLICNNQHSFTLKYESLRRGSGCRTCSIAAQTKPVDDIKAKLVREECLCKSAAGKKPVVCPHHNHKVCKRGGSNEWDHTLNMVLPETVPPGQAQLYWYRCSNDWCNIQYQQRPSHRTKGVRCPYCVGQKVCAWNCLLTNHPELCLELDPDNSIKPDQITPGSHVRLTWLCYKHGDPGQAPFKYTTTAYHRAVHGSGCPRCKISGGDQIYGGHEYFVREANAMHNNAYIYNDPYKGAYIPIEIHCPKVTKNSVHGTFKITPHMHKRGQGCPRCTTESNGSKIIIELHESLTKLGYQIGVNCLVEQSLPGLFHERSLRVDVAIPSEGLIIERDGGYHFLETSRGIENLKLSQTRDLIKDKYCLDNKVNLLRIPYTIESSIDLVRYVIELCRASRLVYASYQHYRDKLEGLVDFSNVTVVIIPCPLKTVVL